jgi:L-2,4-diaminobutyric acid acetyltransferase
VAVDNLILRVPRAEDALAVHSLVAACPPLDANSLYCNLLQCTHFCDTSVIAMAGDDVAGFISGYRPPAAPATLFVWQVAVGAAARGRGLALRMLRHLLARPGCRAVQFLETSVTPGNAPSRALFAALARSLDTVLEEQPWFDRQRHFGGGHDDETLFRIGPFVTSNLSC